MGIRVEVELECTEAQWSQNEINQPKSECFLRGVFLAFIIESVLEYRMRFVQQKASVREIHCHLSCLLQPLRRPLKEYHLIQASTSMDKSRTTYALQMIPSYLQTKKIYRKFSSNSKEEKRRYDNEQEKD